MLWVTAQLDSVFAQIISYNFKYPVYLLAVYGEKWKWSHSVVSDSVTPWTAASQAPPSMGFSRQQYWSGMPLPSPGDLPDSGIEPGSLTLWADVLPSKPPGKPSNIRYNIEIWFIIRHWLTWLSRLKSPNIYRQQAGDSGDPSPLPGSRRQMFQCKWDKDIPSYSAFFGLFRSSLAWARLPALGRAICFTQST